MNYRIALSFILIALFTFSFSETLVTEAKIVEASERGFVLRVGTEQIAVEDGFETRYWLNKAKGKREDFKVGDSVTVRMKTDAAPTQLRELADRTSWQWLERIRKEVIVGTVKAADAKTVTVTLEDGSTFSYRATDKSEIKLKGVLSSIADLKEGQKLYIKGRTLPTLDVWIVSAGDAPPPAKAPAKSTAKPKPKKLPASGKLTGEVVVHMPQFKMFDVTWEGTNLHITYDAKTVFTLNGSKSSPAALARFQTAQITYKRDKFGRIIASKVELFAK